MRINQLPAATEVAQNDVLAIDTSNGTYQVPRSVLAPSPYIATIPTGQWSGSDSDYYITVTASNVTADSILYPFFDSESEALLNGPVWAVPAAGSFTIHTSAIPSGTVTISVLLAGVVGEAQYQVLADVYSKSQVDSIVAQSTAFGTREDTSGDIRTWADANVEAGKMKYIRMRTGEPTSAWNYSDGFVLRQSTVDTKVVLYGRTTNAIAMLIKNNGTWASNWVYFIDESAVNDKISQSTATLSYDRYQNSSQICVVKVGKLCFITCVINSWYNSAAGGTIRSGSATGTEWIISSGFRPIQQCEIKEANNGKRITIGTDGKVTCNEALNGAALRFSGCYICAT